MKNTYFIKFRIYLQWLPHNIQERLHLQPAQNPALCGLAQGDEPPHLAVYNIGQVRSIS